MASASSAGLAVEDAEIVVGGGQPWIERDRLTIALHCIDAAPAGVQGRREVVGDSSIARREPMRAIVLTYRSIEIAVCRIGARQRPACVRIAGPEFQRGLERAQSIGDLPCREMKQTKIEPRSAVTRVYFDECGKSPNGFGGGAARLQPGCAREQRALRCAVAHIF
jgi:hypothetical protein